MKTSHIIVCLVVLAFASLSMRAEEPSSDALTLASSNNTFACDLYAQLKDAEGNLFFSPFSVSSALAMAYAGTKGGTAAQMQKVLRFPESQESVHSGFAALLRHLDAVQSGGQVQLSIANSLWPQKGTPLLENYLTLVKQNYGVELTPVDYKNAEPEARAQINRWVAEKTQDKIQNIIADSLDPATRLVLVNAVYFKGNWLNMFEPDRTKEEPFFIWDEQTIQVPLMQQTKWFLYGEQNDAQFIELPYKGENLSMLVILPADKTAKGMTQIEKQLTPRQIAQWRNEMRRQTVYLLIPKFKITWGMTSLIKPLGKLGIRDAFVFKKADFSNMDGNQDFFISDVIQKAFVEVSEEGTEAAAATAIVWGPGAAWSPRTPPVFRADHPFLLLIRDNATGGILFMGRVVNPKE
jgi:serpin B